MVARDSQTASETPLSRKGALSIKSNSAFSRRVYNPNLPYQQQLKAIVGHYQLKDGTILMQDENGPYVTSGDYMPEDVIDPNKIVPTLPIAYAAFADPDHPQAGDAGVYLGAVEKQEKLDTLKAEYEKYIEQNGVPEADQAPTADGAGLSGTFATADGPVDTPVSGAALDDAPKPGGAGLRQNFAQTAPAEPLADSSTPVTDNPNKDGPHQELT